MTKFANEFWSPQTIKKHLEYSADVIEDIYKKDLNTASESNTRKVMMLEFSQYLENYLWLNFNENATKVRIFLDPAFVLEKAPISKFSFAKEKKKNQNKLSPHHRKSRIFLLIFFRIPPIFLSFEQLKNKSNFLLIVKVFFLS